MSRLVADVASFGASSITTSVTTSVASFVASSPHLDVYKRSYEVKCDTIMIVNDQRKQSKKAK